MPVELKKLTNSEIKDLKCPVNCRILENRIESLADFFAVTDYVISRDQPYWFRGHNDSEWELIPTALRYKDINKRKAALNLLKDFQRIAEIKIDRPPNPNENLKWIQLAQHYGIPTRLLDWTESIVFALYFALIESKTKQGDTNGIVFIINPNHLSELPGKYNQSSLDAPIGNELIDQYMKLAAKESSKGKPTLAIKPVWNSPRLMMQRGAFTFHGSKKFSLDKNQAPSLVGIPILKKYKSKFREELDRIGIDEITMFPELEHVSKNLKRKAGLI